MFIIGPIQFSSFSTTHLFKMKNLIFLTYKNYHGMLDCVSWILVGLPNLYTIYFISFLKKLMVYHLYIHPPILFFVWGNGSSETTGTFFMNFWHQDEMQIAIKAGERNLISNYSYHYKRQKNFFFHKVKVLLFFLLTDYQKAEYDL